MSGKLIVAIIAVAGLLFLGTAVYAHGPGMGWGYGPGNGGHMMGGYGWGHHMGYGYNGYGPHMGYGYQDDRRDGQNWQGQPDNNQYYGYHHGPGYHHGWTDNDGEW